MEYNRPGVETFISKLVGMKAEDLDWASSLGKKYGEKEELDGRGDAARHLALGWLAANAESPSTAKKAIQAREYLDLDYIRELVKGEFAGKEMDLRNNELGMKINAPTKQEAERIISEMIGSGEATYMSPEQSYEMRGYAEGGEAEKEYEYGVGPEASGIGQFLSPLLPVRREVIEPYREEFIESVDPRQMERVVTPGKYGEPELAVPEAVQAFLNFKGLARDPEARQAVMEGLASLPGLPEEISRRLQMSSQAAMSGQDEVYDPVSGGPVTASEALLMTPMLNAPGTAASIARAGDQGGMVLGMMGGTGAKIPSFKPTIFSNFFGRFFGGSKAKGAEKLQKKVDSLIEKGLDGQELWDAQKGQLYRGYYDPSDGQFRIEFDTSKADIKATVPKDEISLEGTYYGPSRRKDMTLDEVLDFPEIFEAYPQFRQIKVKPTPIFSLFLNGAYDPRLKTMYLQTGKDKEKVLSTALHELQHAIQTEEAFLPGSSTNTFLTEAYKEAEPEVSTRKKTLEKEIEQTVTDRLDKNSSELGYGTASQLGLIDKLLREKKNVPDILRDVQELSEITDIKRKVELQDNIQKKLGGSYDSLRYRVFYDLDRALKTFDNDINALLETVEELRPLLPLHTKAEKEYFDLLELSKQASKQYQRTPGEVEARNVQARRSDFELRETYPPDTAEFKPEDMIYPIDPTYRRPYLKIGQQGPEPEGMAMGGGVGSLAPVARNMFNKPYIKRGVGAYAPYIR